MFKNLVIFTVGALAGAAGAYIYTKDKYEKLIDEEIQSVKDRYKKKAEETKKEEQKPAEEPSEIVKEEYKDIVKDNKYVNYTKYMGENEASNDKPVEDEVVEHTDFPYAIDPEEFGEEPGYDTITYTYFADGVLVDDVDDVVDEPEIMVGLENLKIFEEFGASAVYVRNDIYRMDIEILKDDWNWSDIEEAENKRIEKMKEDIEEHKKPHQI